MNPLINWSFRSVFILILFFGFNSATHSQCGPGTSAYTLFLADQSQTVFFTDIAWSITEDATGDTIASQGCLEYTGGLFELCLIPGEDYTFTALDDFGDGWGFDEGMIVWAIIDENGSILFSGENPENDLFIDGTEDCIGFDVELSFTFTAPPPPDCIAPEVTVQTQRNCNESNFDALVTINEASIPDDSPTLVVSTEANGMVLTEGTVQNMAGETFIFNDLPLDTDIVFRVAVLGNSCPQTELVRVNSDSCVFALTCGEAVETTYCYENDDDSEFAYQSPNGEPVSLIFLEGKLEECCDEIFIYDGLDESGDLLFSGNNNGNLANVSVTASSGALFMNLETSLLGSCETNGIGTSEWFWVVGCGEFDIPGCTDPGAFNYNPEATVDNGSCVDPASNDESCGALLLECGAEPIEGTFDLATTEGDLEECVSPFLPSTGDLWFKFEADGTSLYTVSTGEVSELVLGLYTGDDCENLTLVENCTDLDQSVTGTFPEGTYYVLVRPFSRVFFNNFYSVSFTCIPNCFVPFPAVEEASLMTTITDDIVVASWNSIEGQIGCQVQLREFGTSDIHTRLVLGEEASSTSVERSFFESDTQYEWRVRCGCSQAPIVAGPWSSIQTFWIPAGSTISSSPNPTTGTSSVRFTPSHSGAATLEVYDMNGRMVDALFSGAIQEGLDYRFDFDGSQLPDGVYIFRLRTDNEVLKEKFIIAR